MANIVDYAYDDKIIENISAWNYGTNWPVVYIYYNKSKAYVGETLDAVRRTEQHKAEKQFDGFTNVCLITNKTFNKSVIIHMDFKICCKAQSRFKAGRILFEFDVADASFTHTDSYCKISLL